MKKIITTVVAALLIMSCSTSAEKKEFNKKEHLKENITVNLKDTLRKHINKTMELSYAHVPSIKYKMDSLKLIEKKPNTIYEFKGWATNTKPEKEYKYIFTGAIIYNQVSKSIKVSKITIDSI